jgi:hypothetical protein
VITLAKRKLNKVDNKTREIIDNIFDEDVNTMRDFLAREKVIDYINNELRETEDGKRLSFKLSVDDPYKKHWMKDEHFTKIFNHEFKHATEYYSLSNAERLFILDICPFLHWEMNIVVDDKNIPMNQTDLARELDIDVRSVRRNTQSLQEKKIIYIIEHRNEVFYILNPYIAYIGQYINLCIPQLFLSWGYVKSDMVDKNETRNNRSKKQEKRITVRKNG